MDIVGQIPIQWMLYPFFCGLLISRLMNSGSKFFTHILTFTEGSTRLELMQRPDVQDADPSQPTIGYVHLSFAVGSRKGVDLLTRRLAADGYTITSGPRTTGDGYYESSILGPEGIQIEITE